MEPKSSVDVNDQQEAISLDRLKPANIKDSNMIDVTATNNSLLPPSPAIPIPLPTTRTTRSGQHVYWLDRHVTWTYTFTGGKGSNVMAFIKAPLIRN